jgi:tRNA C32,U32 (ribose-2'-O)-methylase TrmJ
MSEKINYLDNCRIILVNTTHPGNVGSAARAMKPWGLPNYILFRPILKSLMIMLLLVLVEQMIFY